MARITQDLNIDTTINQNVSGVQTRIPQTSEAVRKSESLNKVLNLAPQLSQVFNQYVQREVQSLQGKKSKALKYLESGIPEEEVKKIGDEDIVNFYQKAKTVSDVSEQFLKDINTGAFNQLSEEQVDNEFRDKIFNTYQDNHGEIKENDLLYISQIKGLYDNNIKKSFAQNKGRYDQFNTSNAISSQLLIDSRLMAKNEDLTAQDIYDNLLSRKAKESLEEQLGSSIEQSDYNHQVINTMNILAQEKNFDDRFIQATKIPYSTGRLSDINPDTGEIIEGVEIEDVSSFYGANASDINKIASVLNNQNKIELNKQVIKEQESFKKQYKDLPEQDFEKKINTLFRPYATSEAKRREIQRFRNEREEHQNNVSDINYYSDLLMSGGEQVIVNESGEELVINNSEFLARDDEFKQKVSDNLWTKRENYNSDPTTWTTEDINLIVQMSGLGAPLPSEVKNFTKKTKYGSMNFESHLNTYNLFREQGYTNASLIESGIFSDDSINEIRLSQGLLSTLPEEEVREIMKKTSFKDVDTVMNDILDNRDFDRIEDFDINERRFFDFFGIRANKINDATARQINSRVKNALRSNSVRLLHDSNLTFDDIYEEVINDFKNTQMIFTDGFAGTRQDGIIATPAMIQNQDLVTRNIELLKEYYNDIGDIVGMDYDDISIINPGEFSLNRDNPSFDITDSNGNPINIDDEIYSITGSSNMITQNDLLNNNLEEDLNKRINKLRSGVSEKGEQSINLNNSNLYQNLEDNKVPLERLTQTNDFLRKEDSNKIKNLSNKINNKKATRNEIMDFINLSDVYPLNIVNDDEIIMAIENVYNDEHTRSIFNGSNELILQNTPDDLGSEQPQLMSDNLSIEESQSISNNNFNNIGNDFLRQQEGFELEAYIPRNNEGEIIGNSGITIGIGFDIGQHNLSDLRKIGIDENLIPKLEPFLELKGQEAQDKLNQETLQLTEQEVESIEQSLNNYENNLIQERFENINNVPEQGITVIKSLLRNFGEQSLSYKTTNWIIEGDYQSAIDELRDINKWENNELAPRRNQEADLLQQLL